MLHIVQVVLPGSVETPQVFIDKVQAEAAFVASAKKYWRQSYAAFCEEAGGDADDYATAQAFVATFDLADRSRIHEWSVEIETGGAGDIERLLPGGAALQEQQERIQQLVVEVEQASGVVRAGMSELLEILSGVTTTTEPARKKQPSDSLRSQPGQLKNFTAPTAPSTTQNSSSSFSSEERQAFIGSIMHMSGGNRSEAKLFDRAAWRQAVYSDETALEYWDWVADQIDAYIDKAQQAGYSVIDDTEQSDCYWFQTPDGFVGEISCKAAGEAWCRAGLHLEGR